MSGLLWPAPILLPALAALVLALPTFAFTYLWDDYDFMARAHPFRVETLFPDAGTFFYRPLSREVYFAALGPLWESGVAVGHVINTVLLAAAVLLTATLTARLAGRREAILAACVLCGLGAAPILVGWISGAQDLLAGVFGLLAIHFRLRGATPASVVSLAAAILSKETALAFAPVVAALPWILGLPATRVWRGALAVVLLLAAWAAFHPGVRLLLRERSGGDSSYVALGAPKRPEFALRSALALLNIPVTGTETRWPGGRAAAALLAGALVAAAGVASARIPASAGDRVSRGALLLAAMLAAGSLSLTLALVTRWSPYYAFLPAIGLSIGAGIALARLPSTLAVAALVVYLGLGVWSRGLTADPTVTTEQSFEATSRALRHIRDGFARACPDLPQGTQLLVSVPATGSLSVPVHLLRYEAPRVWYRDPTMSVRAPEHRVPWDGPEALVRVSQSLDVIWINPVLLQVRYSATPSNPDEILGPIRTYARALGATGNPDRAVQILLGLESMESFLNRNYDRRLAAMVLHMAGRREEASSFLAGLRPFDPDTSLGAVTKLMTERTGEPGGIDSSAFFAFGLSRESPENYRHLLREADRREDRALAIHAAQRVLDLSPGDSAAAALLARYRNMGPADRITAPALRGPVSR